MTNSFGLLSNMLKLTQATINGEGKLIPLGHLYIKPDTIVVFHSIINDKKVMKDGAIVGTAFAQFCVVEDVDEVRTMLEEKEYRQ